MLLVVVIPHRGPTGLERWLFFPSMQSRAADVFLSAKADIAKLGEKAVLVIRGCTSSLTLNDACVARLLQRVATSTQYVYPEQLHHTSDAAALHSHKTYHKVQAWYGRYIPAGEWGWEQSLTSLVPRIMNQIAAPQTLLKVIHCNCTGQCDRKSCTCRKHGLKWNVILQVYSVNDNLHECDTSREPRPTRWYGWYWWVGWLGVW